MEQGGPGAALAPAEEVHYNHLIRGAWMRDCALRNPDAQWVCVCSVAGGYVRCSCSCLFSDGVQRVHLQSASVFTRQS